MATIIVTEDLAGPAVVGRGGHTMVLLQMLHGLERLGHRVIYIEFLEKDPGNARELMVSYFSETISKWWYPDRAALILEPSSESLYGLDVEQVARIANQAAAVITRAARYRRAPYPLIENVRPRILIDEDPGYTHIWAAESNPLDVYGEHDIYFTVGGNIGTSRCSLPTLDIQWRTTWNPIIPDWWPSNAQITRNHFTTIADWRGYGYLEFEGRILGPKVEEFRKLINLPRLIGETIELSLDIDPEDPDITYLQDNGWKIESPKVVWSTNLYRDFIVGSLGEFSCAKGGYVGTRCGWFSDRSACYLAAGRPVVVQSTGFEDLLPTGKGLFSFNTIEQAVDAIKAIRKDYNLHSDAARDIALEYFDYKKILGSILAEAGI